METPRIRQRWGRVSPITYLLVYLPVPASWPLRRAHSASRLRTVAVWAAALTMTLTLGVATPVAAAATFTFDADGSSLPVADAAADWSKNTNVTVLVGDCAGTGCVHFATAPVPCNITSGVIPYGGCAYRLGDGSCQVEVNSNRIVGQQWLDDLITKHEAGHCIFAYGGKAMSFHLSEPRALMYYLQSSSPNRADARLTSIDRAFTRTLFAG